MLAAGAVSLIGASQHAGAASSAWLNTGSTDANWSTTSNWTGGVVPGAISGTTNTDTATFNSSVGTYGTSGTPILVDSGRNLQRLTFDGAVGAFTIGTTGGNSLLLTSGGAITMNAAVANSQTINAPLLIQGTGGTYSFTNNATDNSKLLNIGGSVSASAGGTAALTLSGSNTGNNTVSGVISNGSAANLTVTKSGAGTWVLTGTNTNTGGTNVSAGTLSLAGASGALTNTASFTLGSGATLLVDDSTANTDRLRNAAGITLNNGSLFNYIGSGSTTSAETTGIFTLNNGVSKITVTANGGNTAKVTTSAVTGGFTRAATTGGIALINGAGLGLAGSGQFVTGTAPTVVGTTAGTSSINTGVNNSRVALFVLGESGTATTLNGTATGTANTFLTYNGSTGFRPLNPTDEFTNNAIATGTNTYLTTGTTSTTGATINSLVLNGGNLDVSASTLTNTSGMLLFAQNGTIGGAGTFTLGGSSNQEGIVAVNSGVTGTISSGLGTGTTGLTVSGSGTLVVTGTNSYGGRTSVGSGATLVIGSNSALGTSAITAAGGTIRGNGQALTLTNSLIATGSGMSIGGSSDLTFAGGGTVSTPAFANSNFANSQVVINNTATTSFTGVFSLLNSPSGTNNGGSVLGFGSSANVVISGPIQDNNAGNVGGTTHDFGTLSFRGVGANVTISGNNSYLSATKKTQFVPSTGYNTVTVGGPGGSGATITPFGLTAFHTNTSTPIFLAAETNGQILGNGFTSGGSGMGFGFVGSNSLTLGGTWVASAGSSLTNLATGALTFGNTISGNSLTLQGTGNTILNSNATLATGAFALTATQAGTVTLSNTNNWTGNTTFSGGTVVLDYSAANANRLTQRNGVASSAAALGLGGVDLQLKGGSFAQTLGTPTSGANGTTLNLGQSKITQTNAGSSTLALGAITRSTGSAIDFQTGVTTTTTANTSGILGGYATVGGTDWATGGGTIAALGSYDSFGTPGTNKNVLQADSATVAATATVNSLKITTSTAGQALTIGSGQTLNLDSGGLLFTGADDYSISGGTLKKTAAGDLIVQHYGAGNLTINSAIGPTSGSTFNLVKAGTGTLALTGSNTNSSGGATFILGGTLKIDNNSNLYGTATSGITINGGTLQTTGGFSTARAIALATNGGTIQVDSGTLTSTGVISGSSYKGLTKTGAGTLELQGSNTFLAPVTVTSGTLKLSSAAALGASSTASNRSEAPIRVNGGTLDINGQTTALGNLTLISGDIADTVGTGSLAAYSFTLQSGTVGASLANVIIAGNSSNSINLNKTTSGTVTLTGANTYTGNTNVTAGKLLVNGSLASGSAVNVTGSSTLGGSGSVGGAVAISGTGTLSPGNSIESLTTGALTMSSGTTFVFEAIDNTATGADLVAANGSLSLTNVTLDLAGANLAAGTWVNGDVLTLISYTGAGITAGFVGYTDDTAYTFGSNQWTINYNDLAAGNNYSSELTGANRVTLTVAVVPEPGTFALLGVAAMGVLTSRRRTKTSAAAAN